MVVFDFFAEAHRLTGRGEPFATATVVRIERPTSGKPGDRAIVTLDGRLHGWVGGSCTKPTVIKEALAALGDGRSRLIRLSAEPDERTVREGITDLSMTCFSGGTMEIFIEPNSPRPRLLIVGQQAVAQGLAALGSAMGYQVFAIGSPAALTGAEENLPELADLADSVHPLTAVVIASHGDHDEVALEHALASDAPYVGLVASAKRAESICRYLKVRGISDERIASLHAPAGLDIQARQPEEIALSILAQIIQLRRARDSFHWQTETGDSHAASGEDQPVQTAVDPVCGMTVEVTGTHRHEHRGTRYYFCCGGCLSRFVDDPESFLAVES